MFRLSPREVLLARICPLPSLRVRRVAIQSAYVHSPAVLPPLSPRGTEQDGTSSSLPSHGRIRTPQEGSGLDSSTAQPSLPSTQKPFSRLHLESEGAEGLTLTAAGEFFLVRQSQQGRKQESIVSHGSVTLPVGAGPETFTVLRQVFEGQKVVEAHVTWGPSAAPVARMFIYSSKAASSRYEWCKVRPCESSLAWMHARTPYPLACMHPSSNGNQWYGWGSDFFLWDWPCPKVCHATDISSPCALKLLARGFRASRGATP